MSADVRVIVNRDRFPPAAVTFEIPKSSTLMNGAYARLTQKRLAGLRSR